MTTLQSQLHIDGWWGRKLGRNQVYVASAPSSEHPAGPDPLGALSKNKSFIVHLCNILLLVHCIVRRAESGDSWSGSRTNQDEVVKLLNLVKLLFPHWKNGDDNMYFIKLLTMRQVHCFPVKYLIRLFLQLATTSPLFITSMLTVLNKCIKIAGTKKTHQFWILRVAKEKQTKKRPYPLILVQWLFKKYKTNIIYLYYPIGNCNFT